MSGPKRVTLKSLLIFFAIVSPVFAGEKPGKIVLTIHGAAMDGGARAGPQQVFSVDDDYSSCPGRLRRLPLQMLGNAFENNIDYSVGKMVEKEVITADQATTTRALYQRFLPQQTVVIEEFEEIPRSSVPSTASFTDYNIGIDASKDYAIQIQRKSGLVLQGQESWYRKLMSARLFAGQTAEMGAAEDAGWEWLSKETRPFRKNELPFSQRGFTGIEKATDLWQRSKLSWEIGGTANEGGNIDLLLEAATQVFYRDSLIYGIPPEECTVFVTAMSKFHARHYSGTLKLPLIASAANADRYIHAISLAEMLKRYPPTWMPEEIAWARMLTRSARTEKEFVGRMNELGMRSFAMKGLEKTEELHQQYWLSVAKPDRFVESLNDFPELKTSLTKLPMEGRVPGLKLKEKEDYRVELLLRSDRRFTRSGEILRLLLGVYKTLPQGVPENLKKLAVYVRMEPGYDSEAWSELGFKTIQWDWHATRIYRLDGKRFLRLLNRNRATNDWVMSQIHETDWAAQWKLFNGAFR